MPPVKSRREMYSEATRAALLDEATTLFAERGYNATSLEDVAAATQVTRGAVYHHFAGKLALFEAVLVEQERAAMAAVEKAATASDPLDAAIQALSAFLDKACEPVYSKLCWQEAPTALGHQRWKEIEEHYAYGVVERFVELLMETGHLERKAQETTTQFFFWMLGGAGLALAGAADADKRRLRDEWFDLMTRSLRGMRP